MDNSLTPPGQHPTPARHEAAVPALATGPNRPSGETRRLESLDVETVWAALWRRRFLIALSTLLVGIAAWVAAGLLTPKYEAAAYLRIDGDGLDVLNEDRRDPTRYVDAVKLASNVQSLGGVNVLRDAAAAAGLQYLPEFNPKLKPGVTRRDDEAAPAKGAERQAGEPDAAVVAALGRSVKISQVGQSGVAEVAVRAEDPVTASRAANAVGQTFIDEQILLKRQRRLKALDALLAQQRALVERLRGVEQRIVAVRQGSKILFNDVRDMRGETFGDIRESLIQSEADLAEAEQKRRLLDSVLNGGSRGADVSTVTFSTLLENLRTQQAVLQAEVVQATGEFGPMHPRLQQAQESLRRVERAIAQELARIGESVRNDEQVLRSRVDTLRSRLFELEIEFKGQTAGQVDLDRLTAEAEALRASLEKLDADLDVIKTSIGLEQSEAHFVSQALVPERPVYPRRKMIAGATSVMWGGLMVLAVSGFALASPRLRGLRDMMDFEETAGVPTVGILPRIAGANGALALEDEPGSAGELRKVAAALDLSANTASSVLVRSTQAGDGGATVAAALATLSAKAGLATIAIELDERGKLARMLGVEEQAGLADCVRLGIDPLAAIVPCTVDKLHLLTHGGTENGFISLAATALDQVHERLRTQYKVVLILAPPLDHSRSRLTLEVDDLIFVSKAERDRANVIARYLRSQGVVAAKRAANVLNMVDPSDSDQLHV